MTKSELIDRLAEEGVVFEKTIASVPVTLPSHTSLFTGSYPISHGVRDNGVYRVPDELRHIKVRWRCSCLGAVHEVHKHKLLAMLLLVTK